MGQRIPKPLCFLAMALTLCSGLSGCLTEAPTVVQPEDGRMVLVTGRAIAVITGERARKYAPEVRQVELMQRHTDRRYSVMVEANDKAFAFFLPAGEYEVTRVQISEGPFLSIAQLASSFSIGDESIAYVGTWRFGVDSPRYGRMVLISMVADDELRPLIEEMIRAQYPAFASESLTTVVPLPAETVTRLYEVLPYPRYPKYFQRHVW
ncbi:MAG: hypothetical protein OJF47_002034 [Nitrospira sp.]|jgi:hypothetical protein|nr:MAG: hypothetical protein OJF47_002034 [Nitrospira sp.]